MFLALFLMMRRTLTVAGRFSPSGSSATFFQVASRSALTLTDERNRFWCYQE